MPPPPQTPAFGQVPQSSVPPQPSPIEPQYRPPTVSQVRGTHPALAHTRFVQVSPAAQPPQSMASPQPSPMLPQNFVVPAWHVPVLTQVESPTQTLFEQVHPARQAPQSIVPPQP